MSRARGVAVAVAVLALAGGACHWDRDAPAPPPDQARPAVSAQRRALGDKAIAQTCQMCHTLDLVESQRLGRAAWQKELTKMKGWGAPLLPEDEPLILDVLADRAGPEAAPPQPRAVALGAAEAEVAPDAHPPAGDARRGAALYRTACASCHGPTGIGGTGPALVERPVIHRAHEFETVVRVGRERMPAFPLDTPAIHDLLAFLRATPR